MKAKLIFLMILLIGFSVLYGYQNNFFNLSSPTSLNDWDSEITISHRFYGNIDHKPFDTFFGMDLGANTGLFYRKSVSHGAEVKLGYIREKNEYVFEGSYLCTPVDFAVQAQVAVQYFTFKELSETDRRQNLLYSAAIQTHPIKNLIVLNMNAGYDGYYQRFINGFGIGIIPKHGVTVQAEYFPTWDRKTASDKLSRHISEHDSFTFGIRLDTYGHQFAFMLGNSSAMSAREMSLGSLEASALKFGFNIQRRFEHNGE